MYLLFIAVCNIICFGVIIIVMHELLRHYPSNCIIYISLCTFLLCIFVKYMYCSNLTPLHLRVCFTQKAVDLFMLHCLFYGTILNS